tara:strand:- start:1141 stop:1554 length:414 start_codon:yes stop_codon:yes gene_type:complete
MKKVKKINHSNIKNIVKEHFLNEKYLLPESRIDSIINEYLSERDEYLDDENSLEDKTNFSSKTSNALGDMVEGINEMLGDLEVIKEKEGNVLVYQNEYSDEYLEDVIEDLEDVVDRISALTELSDDEDLDYDDLNDE